VVIHLVCRLVTGHMHLVSVDNDYVIAGIDMWCLDGLVLAPQATRDFRGQSTQRFTCRINDIPVAIHFMGFCGECFHGY